MIIVQSKNKTTDYYDGVCRQHGDKNVRYIRDIKELFAEENIFNQTKLSKRWYVNNRFTVQSPVIREGFSNKRHSFTHFLIGFCGKIYCGYTYTYAEEYNYEWKDCKVEYCFDLERIKTICSQIEHKRTRETVESHIQHFSQVFDYFKHNRQLEELFKIYNCPIFTITDTHMYQPKITINDVLKNYGFYKVFDAYQTFQELYMYLANIAVPMKHIPTISDEMKAYTHGFNKFSFRKPKSK